MFGFGVLSFVVRCSANVVLLALSTLLSYRPPIGLGSLFTTASGKIHAFLASTACLPLDVNTVWLGCENAFEKLKRDGYKFYDHDFYKKFFNSTIDNQIQQLYHFLDHIRKSDQVKKQMEKIAKENYINFWNTRKIDIPYQNYKILKQCFGDSLHEVAYDYCNF